MRSVTVRYNQLGINKRTRQNLFVFGSIRLEKEEKLFLAIEGNSAAIWKKGYLSGEAQLDERI